MKGAAFVGLIAALWLGACGQKSIATGSRPFPAEKAVFVDASGNPLTQLPDAVEPLRLVVLDFPWCPPCADAWGAVRTAVGAAPPGSVAIYRILFDRELLITSTGKTEKAPIRPAPPPWPGDGEEGGAPKVTTLTALPGSFLEEYRLNQAPVLLLIDRNGKVARRWTGYSTNLGEELSEKFRTTAPVPPALPRR